MRTVERGLTGARGLREVLLKANVLAESLAARADEDVLSASECLRIALRLLMRLVEVSSDAIDVEEIAANWTGNLVRWRRFGSHRVLEASPAKRREILRDPRFLKRDLMRDLMDLMRVVVVGSLV